MISLASIIVLAVAIQAAPAERASSGTFSIPAVRDVNYIRNGTAAMLHAYKKYNLEPTQAFSDAFLSEITTLWKRQDSSVTAFQNLTSGSYEYLVAVDIGGETLNLNFDTGSSDLRVYPPPNTSSGNWVFSTLLPTSEQTGHNIYDSSQSPTYQDEPGSTWGIKYGDESTASGVCGTDTVTVGEITVTGQVVELADQVSSSFVSDNADGLLGLAFSSINTVEPQKASTFFDNAQPSLDSPLFAAYLPKNANGSYDFGAFDSSRFTGSLVYTDVDDTNGFWEYPSTSFIVSTADGSLSDSMNNFTGITDTGTTLILMADVAVNAYYDQVSGATYSEGYGGYVFDCSTSLPDLSVQIGDEYATVPGSFLNFAPVSQDGPCFGGIQSVGNGTMNIYGGVFLNAFYGVFDDSGATPSFGYAPSTGPTS